MGITTIEPGQLWQAKTDKPKKEVVQVLQLYKNGIGVRFRYQEGKRDTWSCTVGEFLASFERRY